MKQKMTVSINIEKISEKIIILVDNVSNSGRTLYYATKPLLNIIPRRLQAAVLVDRTHKLFPIHVDYVGMSLATTLKQNIEVDLEDGRTFSRSEERRVGKECRDRGRQKHSKKREE